MRGAVLEEFQRDPVGRYVQGETFAHFCAHPGLWGVLLWGRPNQDHARQLGRSLVVELAPPATPHVSIVDAGRVEGVDAGAFAAAEFYLSRFGPQLQAWVTQLALVRPPGFGGAIVAGAYEVMPRPYPVMVFSRTLEALAWLSPERFGGPAPTALELELAELHGSLAGIPPLVRALRARLDANLESVRVAEVASALGLSERTLQRKLGEVATTFQDEVAEARVRAAKRLLLESDASLTAIAFETGCPTLQHFSSLFRKRTGQSPSAWRRHHRGLTARR